MTTEQATKQNVLLLDDDKFLADMYAVKFSSEGFNVEAHLQVKDAIQALEGGFPADAIVFDIVMQNGDGFHFLQELTERKLAARALKIALTNQSNDDDKRRAQSLGADLYLVKASLVPSEVVETVREALAKRK